MDRLISMSFSMLSARPAPPPMPVIAPLRIMPAVVFPLPGIELPGILRPAPVLKANPERSEADDVGGFGPAKMHSTRKKMGGIMRFELALCTDPSHETSIARKYEGRVAFQCRGCLQRESDNLPVHTTVHQRVRFLTGLFRSYFCPFCMMETAPAKINTVSAKSHCKKHTVINSLTKCDAHDVLWHYCKECADDPRSATFYCACAVPLSNPKKTCRCPPKVSYGIRLHTDPFVVPTAEVRAQEEKWVADKLERAAYLQDHPDSVAPPPKRQCRRAGIKIGPYAKP